MEYKRKKEITEMIGIAISTHNRYEVFKKTYDEMVRRLPKGAKLVVVDDASDVPVPEATFRFEQNAGIAVVKNKCLELLEGCDDIFLFDDDCYPVVDGWFEKYVQSKEPHLCYIFKDFVNRELNDCKELYKGKDVVAYSHARGCMLYFKKICMETIGGFDTRHKRWGGEHIQISDRIYNVGLTSFRYQDVIDSKGLFYSADEHEAVEGTVPMADRRRYLLETKQLRAESKTATNFCEYKTAPERTGSRKGRNVVLCAFLTQTVDAQRNMNWKADYLQLKPLIDSTTALGIELIILNDCFDKEDTKLVKHVKVETVASPYWQRWIAYYQYIREHDDLNNVFVVDATDVEVLHNPFPHVQNEKLYIGDESGTLNNSWLIKMHPSPVLSRFFRLNRTKQMLNCGVVGGNVEVVSKFVHDLYSYRFDIGVGVGETEMGAFNHLCYTKWADKIIHGRQVTTEFKKEEYTDAWIKHK